MPINATVGRRAPARKVGIMPEKIEAPMIVLSETSVQIYHSLERAIRGRIERIGNVLQTGGYLAQFHIDFFYEIVKCISSIGYDENAKTWHFPANWLWADNWLDLVHEHLDAKRAKEETEKAEIAIKRRRSRIQKIEAKLSQLLAEESK